MVLKKWSGWLKGGLILTLLDFLIFLLFTIWAYVGSFGGSDLSGLAVAGGIYYGFISLIPAFLIGSVIGVIWEHILKQNEDSSTKGMKIGFYTSLISILVYFVLYLLYQIINGFSIDNIAPATIVLPITIIIASSIIGWFIGKNI